MATDDGYVILEVNPVPGGLGVFGEEARRETLAGIYDWVEKQAVLEPEFPGRPESHQVTGSL